MLAAKSLLTVTPANFRGAYVKVPGGGGDAVGNDDSGIYYILGIDPAGKTRLYSYNQSDISSVATDFSDIVLTLESGVADTKGDDNFAAGSMFVQANELGTPMVTLLQWVKTLLLRKGFYLRRANLPLRRLRQLR